MVKQGRSRNARGNDSARQRSERIHAGLTPHSWVSVHGLVRTLVGVCILAPDPQARPAHPTERAKRRATPCEAPAATIIDPASPDSPPPGRNPELLSKEHSPPPRLSQKPIPCYTGFALSDLDVSSGLLSPKANLPGTDFYPEAPRALTFQSPTRRLRIGPAKAI